MKTIPTSLAGARVLVTGGAGFVGSHLCEALLASGCDVVALDNLSSGSRAKVEHLGARTDFRLVVGDVADEDLLARHVEQADMVFHLAGAVGAEQILAGPLRSLRASVSGTATVLRVAARYEVPVVLASSAAVYGKSASFPQCEEDDIVLGASSVRGWSDAAGKLLDEFHALSYHRECGLPVVVFRLFNAVGAREAAFHGRVLPRFAEAVLSRRALEINGDGLQTRAFVHVADAVDAIVRLACAPAAAGKVFNVGTCEETSILELAELVLARAQARLDPRFRRLGQHAGIVFREYGEAFPDGGYEDVRRRVPDTARLTALTGWAPQRTLIDAVDDLLSERLAGAPPAAARLTLV